MFVKRVLLYFLLLLCGRSGFAQDMRAQIAARPELAGGLFRAYEFAETPVTPAPKGYKPFYISHFGRHGCRWHIDPKFYTQPLALLRMGAEEQALTPLGESLLARMEVIAADAEGRYGDLAPRGVEDHRGIAERMYNSFPEVFSTRGRPCRVECRSTLVPRCILSMAAFSERLKELDPALHITRVATERDLKTIYNSERFSVQFPQVMQVIDSLRPIGFRPRRFVDALVRDTTLFSRQEYTQGQFMEHMYQLSAIMQDVDYLGISLYDLFTPEEFYTCWETVNKCRYLVSGPSVRFGDALLADAGPLLAGMIRDADRAVAGEGPAASLRFCHDVNIMPLAALLGIECASARVSDLDSLAGVWNDFLVSPMAVNIQLIFFRKGDDVLVKALFNEQEVRLPVSRGAGPYYRWEDFKKYYREVGACN